VKRLFLLIVFILRIPFASARSAASLKTEVTPLTIENIFAEGGITGRDPESVQWSPDSTKFSFVQRDDSGEHGALWYVDGATGEKKILVDEARLSSLAPGAEKIKDEREKERVTRYHIAAYQWAPDSKHLLFDSQGQLWLYSIDNGTSVQFTAEPDPTDDPKFSPDGRQVAYVRKHNLYVRSVGDNQEKPLTRDRDENLLDGEVDWVYAEELDVRSNYFWAPDGKSLLFLQMDETHVPAYPITDWMPTHAHADPEKFPQPGDPNPAVRLGIVAVPGGKVKWISLGSDSNMYIPRFGWVREGVIWAEVLNRTQDEMDLYFVDAASGRSRKVLTESSPDGWVKVNDAFRILKPGNQFLWSSWRDGTTQLYLYSFDQNNPLGNDAKLERQLTRGDFEVFAVDEVDDAAGRVYFTCNKDDPRQRQLYSVKLDGSDLNRVSQGNGTHESTDRTDELAFAPDARHYVDFYSTQVTPPRMSLCATDGSCRAEWESRSVEDFGLTAPRPLEFKADDGTTLYGELLLPPRPKPTGKIPLIVYIYGGPADQLVRDHWMGTTGLFHQLLAREGFAIFSVDNRGTPARDRKFQTAIRHEFGAIELKDQLAALDQLFAQYAQLDRSRVAIWGWSNGGSMTLYSMTHSDAFKTGVSVAPVTDWRDYDSIYTERLMGLPQDNAAAYADSIVRSAGNLHGSLLLVHGTSDDNVHFQNSIQMVEALINAGKQFRFMVYPGKTHGITGTADRTHLFHLIQEHFEQELK